MYVVYVCMYIYTVPDSFFSAFCPYHIGHFTIVGLKMEHLVSDHVCVNFFILALYFHLKAKVLPN